MTALPIRRVVALAALVAALALTASSARANFGPGYSVCGNFVTSGLRIHVYAKHVSCARARSIQREVWLGKRRNRVVVNGGSGALGYVLLKRFPGWKCTSGSGAGSCNKGKASAAYTNEAA